MSVAILLTIYSVFVYFVIYYFRKKISKILNVFDLSNEKRKIHKLPTPKTASYSIGILIVSSLVLNYFINVFEKDKDIVILFSGTLLIFFIGFIDDRYKLSAIKKTILISLVTFLLCTLSDAFIVDRFYIKSLDFFFKLEHFSIFFTILCVLCLTNALNLADGINGLATGIIFFWLFYINQIYNHNFDLMINILFINLFLIFFHNYKGKHFLGDSGSLMLSAFLAFFIIMLHNQSINDPNHQKSAESLLILFIIPVLDMVRLFFARLLSKKNIAEGDNNHLHHYLINRYNNFIALIIYFFMINIPTIVSLNTDINKLVIILLTLFMYILTIYIIKIDNEIK